MANLKVVLVGAGSMNWTPRVMCNLLENAHLKGAHIELFDIDDEALERMPAPIEAIVRPHAAREDLIIDAALAAMATDPLVGPGDTARRMLEEMLAANREWLPRFG